jgi:hypothetical protein
MGVESKKKLYYDGMGFVTSHGARLRETSLMSRSSSTNYLLLRVLQNIAVHSAIKVNPRCGALAKSYLVWDVNGDGNCSEWPGDRVESPAIQPGRFPFNQVRQDWQR